MSRPMLRAVKKISVCAVMAAATWIVSLLTVRYIPNGILDQTDMRLLSVKQNASRDTTRNTSHHAVHKVTAKINLPLSESSELRSQRKTMEKSYYLLSEHKINRHDINFILKGERICDSLPNLVVIVPTIHERTAVRQAIRKTWGLVAKNGTWPKENIQWRTEIVFLLGKGQSPDKDKELKEESMRYRDIVQGDFVDSYHNLTRKILLGLKWVTRHCSDVDYILKADDDVFVHIPNLMRALNNATQHLRGTIYGAINYEARVWRRGKWSVSRQQFPLKYYPTYASGNSYVLTGNIAPRLFMVSEYMPYIPIEDAFITGVLARMIGAEHVPIPGCAYWIQPVPDPCSFLKTDIVSSTKVDVQKMYDIWETLYDHSICSL